MMARCLRDKVPKGDYVIRASVMDRLTDNKMYYKIIEYGERVKEQRLIEKEKAKRQAEEDQAKLADMDNSQMLQESKISENQEVERAALLKEDEEFREKINRPVFDASDDEGANMEDNTDEEGDKKKVKWDAGIVDKSPTKPVKKATLISMSLQNRDSIKQAVTEAGLLSNALHKTKIGFDIDD